MYQKPEDREQETVFKVKWDALCFTSCLRTRLDFPATHPCSSAEGAENALNSVHTDSQGKADCGSSGACKAVLTGVATKWVKTRNI